MVKKIVKGLWIFFALMVLAGIAVFASIAYGWIGYMPPVEELENPNYKFATEILSEDGKVLGTWSLSKENRVYTSYNELSPNIINALIATEDVRFAEHSGIDAKALIRAVVKRGLLMQKTQVEVVRSRSNLPSSCSQMKLPKTLCNVCFRNR